MEGRWFRNPGGRVHFQVAIYRPRKKPEFQYRTLCDWRIKPRYEFLHESYDPTSPNTCKRCLKILNKED